MATRVQIVKRIEDHVEIREPIHVETAVLDVRMVGFELCAWLKLLGNFLRDLCSGKDIRQLLFVPRQ